VSLSVREMFLIVRAQDQASRTLASVGRNLSALSRQSAVADRALQLQASRASLAARQSALTARRVSAARAGDTAALSRYAKQLEATQLQARRLALQEAALGTTIRNQRWNRVTSGLHALSDVGRVAQYSGAIATGALGAMAYGAANFNTEITRAATQTGRSFGDIVRNAKALEPQVIDVMRHSASSSEELTSALYEIYSSLSVTRQGGVRLLQTLSNAAIGGMAPLEDVTKGVITVMNNFGDSVQQAPGYLQRMFAAVRFGRTTFDEFAGTLSTIVPAAHQQNQTFDNMAGTIAFLTRTLGNVSRASVGYARALELLNRQKFVDNMKKAGVAVRDAKNQMLPLPVVLRNITDRFPGLIKGTRDWQNFITEMSGTQGTIQARRAIVELTHNLDGYERIVKLVTGDNVEFTRSVRAMRQTPGVQFKEFTNQLKAFSLELGAGAIPAFQKMIGFMETLLEGFHTLDGATKGSIGNITTWVAVLTTAAGTVAVLAGAVGRLGVGLRFLGGAGLAGTLLFGRSGNQARIMTQDIARARQAAQLESAILAGTAGAQAGGLFGAARNLRGLSTVARDAYRVELGLQQAAGRAGTLRALLAGGSAAMGAMSVGATALTVALPVAAAAGGLLYLNMRRASEKARELEAAQRAFRSNLSITVGQPLGIAQKGPGAFLNARAQLQNLKEVNAQIKLQRDSMKGLSGAERDLAEVNLSRLMDNRRSVMQALHRSTVNVRDAQANYTRALEGTEIAFDKEVRQRGQLIKLQREMARIEGRDFRGKGDIERTIELRSLIPRLQAQVAGLGRVTSTAFAGLDNMVARGVRALRQVGAVPRLRGALPDITQFARQVRRFPRIQEIKALIKAEIDPRSLKDAPDTVRRFFRTRIVKIPIALETRGLAGNARVIQARARATARQLGAGAAATPTKIRVDADTRNALRQAAAARQRIAAAKAHFPVDANTGPARQAVGGLLQWINSQTAMIHITVDAERTKQDVINKYGIHSPPKVIQDLLDKHPAFLRISTNKLELLDELTGVIKAVKDLQKEKKELLHQGNLSAEDKRRIQEIGREIKDTIQQAWRDAVKTGTDFLIDRFRTIRETISGSFGLALDEFNQLRLDWGVALNVSDLTAHLNETNNKLKGFTKNMQELVRAGVPRSLLLQLAGMGPEGQSIIDAMAGATPAQRREFMRAWRQNQTLIRRASMQQFRMQLKEWRKMGRSMALGIMLGLRDEENGLYRYFRRLFTRIIRESRRSVKAHSPSMEFYKLGQDIVEGLERGLRSPRGLDLAVPGAIGASGRYGTNVTMNVYPHAGESTMATMERAKFRLKNQLRS